LPVPWQPVGKKWVASPLAAGGWKVGCQSPGSRWV